MRLQNFDFFFTVLNLTTVSPFLLNMFFFVHILIISLLFSSKNILNFFYLRNWILLYFFWSVGGCFILYLLKFYCYQFIIDSSVFKGVGTYYLSHFHVLSDVLICLSLIVTAISWVYLSERFLFKMSYSIFYFYIFILCTINMVYSSNLLVMFIYFEFLFLPSLFFVYQFGYSKKVDKTIFFLLAWTLFGSFFVLMGLIYLFIVSGSLSIFFLTPLKFSLFENFFLFFIFFIGFGIKIPVWPFYYWLTKVHVEAPTGFSIFLSGFLVKTAFFCFTYFYFIFKSTFTIIFMLGIICWGVCDSSIRMWTSTDIKRLIAYATIQEMNFIVLFLVLLNSANFNFLNLFLFVHGILSALFFFLVDQIQKRYGTRGIVTLTGLVQVAPLLTGLIWVSLLVFRGFPIFIKFFIEWEILSILVTNFFFCGFLLFLLASLFGVIGFFRIWLTVMYGQPTNFIFYSDLLKRDLIVGSFLLSFLVFFSVIFSII